VQDVIPPKKKTIRNIPLPKGRAGIHTPAVKKSRKKNQEEPTPKKTETKSQKRQVEAGSVPPQYVQSDRGATTWRKRVMWAALLLLALVIFLVINAIFSGATLKITPRHETKTLATAFTASRIDENSDEIPYQIVVLSAEQRLEVTSTDTVEVERKASGRIIIYNNYSAENQILVATTRFETPEGKIYRIKDSITVPGKYTEDRQTIPGSIEVTVYADKAGDAYNTDPTDFTIPGFKGMPQFDGFYARSKTPITGGFVGREATASEEDTRQAEGELQVILRDTLTEEAKLQIPNDYIFFPDAVAIEYRNMAPEVVSTEKIKIRMEATLSGVLFNKSRLETEILKRLLPNEQNIYIADFKQLSFTTDQIEKILQEEGVIEFILSGDVPIVWAIDQDVIKQSIAAKKRSAIQELVSQNTSISKAEIKLQPFWRRSFPKKTNDIVIEITDPLETNLTN